MTAVEWFAKQVLEYKSPTNINGTDYILIPTNKIEFLQEQAKKMEMEQIIEAFITSRDPYGISVGNSHSIKKAEQYYNETFKSE